MSDAKLFISYSHRDNNWLELLQTQFAVLSQQGQVTAWSDEHIRPGDSWSAEIQDAMANADIAVLLVTDNFLASKFIMDVELPTLIDFLENREGRLRRIMPLIVEPCLWKLVPTLNALEVRPKGHELAQGDDYQRKRDLADFALEVAKILFEAVPPASGLPPQGGPVDHGEAIAASERSYATLEIRLAHCEWNHYKTELSFTWSGDRKWDFVHRYPIALDLDELADLEEVSAYADTLGHALFPNEAALDKLQLATDRATEKRVPLRVRVCIEPSARELHTLNWESLELADGSDSPLFPCPTSFARYTLGSGANLRPVVVRRRSEPEALLLGLIADPGADDGKAPDDEHLLRVDEALKDAGIATRSEKPILLLEELETALRRHDGIDVVFLSISGCREGAEHEAFCGHARDLSARAAARRDIADAFEGLERMPRLVVIDNAGGQSAEGRACRSWLVYLAHELTEQGVLGVLTLQGALATADWTRFLTVFFRQIKDHGQADQAAFVAREQIRESDAPWAPAVVSRLRSGKLWYLPRFMRRTATPGTSRATPTLAASSIPGRRRGRRTASRACPQWAGCHWLATCPSAAGSSPTTSSS
ncbi:MAG: toll/interleukin-1 receptor domain-containing protein [Chromatiaceae bacterium]|nr:toll/interleukin-1 receptor domain-containing protein [Chromatiaceae bacterium]